MKQTLRSIQGICLVCLLLAATVAHAQPRTVSGTVADKQTGEPMPGVSVVLKGSTLGTTTDSKGAFQLKLPAQQGTLLFSFLGYKPLEIQAGGNKDVFDVTLDKETLDIEQVVVVGYGVQKKVNLTGAISTMEGDDISRRPVMLASSALQGLSAGVTVTQSSGQPGSDGSTIRIRGVGTLNNSDALVLVDGVEGKLDGVNPNDIESISVLKDAASAAIYGSRAANGVILVTTKIGTQEKLSVSYNGYAGFQRFTTLPEFVDGYTYMKAMNDAYANLDMTPLYSDAYLRDYLRYKRMDPDNYPDTDWQKEVYTGSGFTQSHHVSVSGGKRVNVLASFGYQDQDGLLPHFSSDRYSFRLNAKMNITKAIEASMLVDGRRADINSPTGSAAVKSSVNRIPNIYPARLSDGRWGTGLNGNNPLALVTEGGMNNGVYYNLRASFQVNIKPFDGASVEFNFTPKYSNSHVRKFNKAIETYDPGRETPAYTSPAKSSLNESDSKTTENLLRVIARYNKTFGSHEIGVLAGYEQIASKTRDMGTRREGFPLTSYPEMNAGSTENMSNSGGASEWALLSWFGRINYAYKSRYLFEANVRIDGSSRFARGHRFGTFPSVSVGWRLSEEAFLKEVRWISNLKLRASWGQLGNQQIGTYPAYTTITLGPSFIFGGKPADGGVQKSYANEGITWETTETTDVGLDVALLGNKLSATFDFYNRKTKDILLTLPLPGITGMNEPYQNAGVVQNRGWDLELKHANTVGKFSYQIGFTLSDVHNKILDLKGAGPIISGYNLKAEGYPINSIYGYKALGLFRTEEQLAESPKQTFSSYDLGDIRYTNLSDAGTANTIDREDRTVIGNQIPRFTYGLNLSAQYRNFDLSVLIQGVGKKDVIYTGDVVWALYNAGKMQAWQTDYWSKENPDASYPRPIAASSHNNFQNSSFWVYDAAYLRLKNLQIGYTLPAHLTRKIWIDKLRVYFTGDNLLTWDKMPKGWDPETPSGDAEIYPITQTFVFGIQLTF